MPMSPPGSSQIFPAQPSMTGAVSQTPAGVQRPPGQSAGALQSFSQNVPLGSGPIPAGHKFRQGPSPHRTPGPPSLVLQPLVLPSITHVGSSGHPEGGAPKGAEAVATVALGSEADVAALAVALRATAEEALAVAEARARPDPGNATVLVVSLSFLSEHASAKVVAAASTKTRARMAGCYTGACAAGRESASGSGTDPGTQMSTARHRPSNLPRRARGRAQTRHGRGVLHVFSRPHGQRAPQDFDKSLGAR